MLIVLLNSHLFPESFFKYLLLTHFLLHLFILLPL